MNTINKNLSLIFGGSSCACINWLPKNNKLSFKFNTKEECKDFCCQYPLMTHFIFANEMGNCTHNEPKIKYTSK